jgi:kynurenine formamidase
MTHLDAINHLWSVENGMWGGRDASREVDFRGIRWADVSKWRSGIVTRGVFLDIPRLRGEPYVTVDRPVQGSELYEAAQLAGVEVLPGDAVVVYCGREAWEAEGAGHEYVGAPEGKPGLDASCIPFIRETDLSLLMWDMADAEPNPYGTAATVHHVLWAFGVCLVDNCQLAPLAEACARKQQYEFMTSVSPIPVVGGTGSPVNPIAVM